MDESYSYESPSMVASPMINYRKDARKGVKFTFMVVGESGTGKTTFVNSLLSKKVMAHRFENSNLAIVDTNTISFTSAKNVTLPNTSILTRNDFDPAIAHEEPGIAITETKVEIIDDANTKLQLTIVDTPGFGDNLNNEVCFNEIENYLKQQFDLVLAEETRIKRNPRFVDTRVHVMLYFISPGGHGLKELDISCMKKLSKYVNIVPVVAKADAFTVEELAHFKSQIKIDLEKFNVPIFQFDNYLNEYDEDEDYDLIQECKYLASIQPFSVISSEDEFEVVENGRTKVIKARQYPWGIIDIMNKEYSDFPVLKSVLLGSHLQDFKDLTHDFLYESYRTDRLTKVTGSNLGGSDAIDDGTTGGDFSTSIPSLSNLAQLTSTTALPLDDDNASFTSTTSSKKPKSMLLDDSDLQSSPRKDSASFTSSTSTISLDQSPRNLNTNNPAFKRLSIAPQRNQLRQISETVPYVIRHERIAERQQKLEEMEMASAKELAHRAAMLEKRAAELKAREKALKKQMELHKEEADESKKEEADHSIRKEETLTDLHSIVKSQ
ncbi:seventh homolog of septin 1 [[Candida] jaroonii]|uniref:Seventh homolog of septin 1 n=1 Tax=[Candida] jaroonii TaxID=467808 RepID=A0ACA9Y829_9ASCO|nr:seventh homolog of septin 1 [[Candida] jaroonii]